MNMRRLPLTPTLFASFSLLVLLLIQAGPLVTPVCGPITSDTTWTLAASPYVATCDVTVNAGVTLTVQPGVVVRFQTQACDLVVNGRLIAQGTEANPIAFTSYKDDAHGGDTKGDGNATTPAPNDWGGIQVAASSSGSVLDHTWIGYGGYGGTWANVRLYTSDVPVQKSTIAWSAQRGIHVAGVDPDHPVLAEYSCPPRTRPDRAASGSPGADTRQRIRESLVQSEPSPAFDTRLNAGHSCPLDTCTHSDAPPRAGSQQISNECAFSARTAGSG